MGGGSPSVQISPGERALADISEKQWNDYKTNFAPLDKQIIARAQDKNRGRALISNMATGAAGQAANAAEQTIKRRMMGRGVNVNSGSFMQGLGNAQRARGAGVGLSGAKADTASDQRYARTMMNAIAHGRGVKGVGVQGMNSAASLSSRNAISQANYQSQANAARMSAIGSIVGMAGAGVAGITAPGANGAASGWGAYSQARDAGAGFSESFGIMRGQMAANRSN